MSSPDLRDLICRHKDYIIQEMKRRLDQLQRSPYQDFILRTKDGQRRFDIWVDLVIRSLDGNHEPFFADQERVGYSRDVQGFGLENAFQIYNIFKQVIFGILQRSVESKKIISLNLCEDLEKLNEILFQGYRIVTASFMKTREERITEKVTHLKELYRFTQEIITIFDLEEIANLILSKMKGLFGVEETYIAICRDLQIQVIYNCPSRQDAHAIRPIMEKTLGERATLFMDEGGNVYSEVNQSNLKRVVSVPIQAHGRCHGVLALYNRTRGFKFTDKELSLLYQFIHIMAVALENAFMLEEIEKRRQELRLLTSKMITIQEEERKRLAADIHDTLAQALAGLSYKIQFCKELVKNNPKLLIEQLDGLIKTVHHAIDQSRELISNLRPDLIDTMGLVPALRRLIDNFIQETGIKVTAHLPKRIEMPPGANICLFRVAQEALTNVYKHADTKNAEVILQKKDVNIILTLSDNGKGFDMSQGAPWMKDKNKLGVLSMKERVEAVGGTLFIDSKVNRGCRIEAKIPFTVKGSSNE